MNQNFVNNNLFAGEGESQTMDSIKQQNNYNGMQLQQHSQCTNNSKIVCKKAYVKITEQPARKALRFRYECEGRSAGSIPGINSTPENKTFPTIQIVGIKGRAVVVVSCVTKDQPYRPHPHNLVGKEGCKKGVCTVEINPDTMRAVFNNLGIQCVKKKDIEAALKAREEIRVDPFKTGFTHRLQPSSIDLNSVRLCFQVFVEGDQKGRFTQPLRPVVSEPIFDKKSMPDLSISLLCSCSASVLGNTQIILLCEKVAKEDISVRFYEETNGQTIWEAFGEFQHTDVYKQTGIAFRTPRYHNVNITEPAEVFVQLKRPSDGATSEPLPFQYKPLDSDPSHLKRKRLKTNGSPVHLLLKQQENQLGNVSQDDRQSKGNFWCMTNLTASKPEPKDTSPQHFSMYRTSPELPHSLQPVSSHAAYAQNAPLSYNIPPTLPAGTHNGQQFVSLNQQYNDFNQQQHQQYNGSNFGAAGTAHLEITQY